MTTSEEPITIDQIKESLSGLIKIELTGERGTFTVFRGQHPGTGQEAFPWESYSDLLVAQRVSVFQGLNTLNDPGAVNYDIYVMEDTDYDKICDLLLFFDFGQDSFPDEFSGQTFNSNDPDKRARRKEAAERLLRHFHREPLSILSLTSENLLFASQVEDHKRNHFLHLGEATWHHNNTYYPRPKILSTSQPHYSLEHYRTLGGTHGVFSVGWGDC